MQSYLELVRVFQKYVDIDTLMLPSAPGRIAVEERWPWRMRYADIGLAARCAAVVQNDAARGCHHSSSLGRDTGAAYERRHLFCGASVDQVSFITPRLVDVPPPGGA